MIIKKKNLNFVFDAVFYFPSNINVLYIILKLLTQRTQNLLKNRLIVSGGEDMTHIRSTYIFLI